MAVRTIVELGTGALALLLLALVWGFTPIARFANPEAVAGAMAVISASPWQFAIVLGCFLSAGLVVFPVVLLIIACAAVFGPVLGFVYSSAGLLASAALNYAIGTWLGHEMLLNALGRHFASTRSALMRRGLITTAVVRAIPGVAFRAGQRGCWCEQHSFSRLPSRNCHRDHGPCHLVDRGHSPGISAAD